MFLREGAMAEKVFFSWIPPDGILWLMGVYTLPPSDRIGGTGSLRWDAPCFYVWNCWSPWNKSIILKSVWPSGSFLELFWNWAASHQMAEKTFFRFLLGCINRIKCPTILGESKLLFCRYKLPQTVTKGYIYPSQFKLCHSTSANINMKLSFCAKICPPPASPRLNT